ILIFGVPIFLGGIWLAWLGGSWYYIVAGLGLLLTAVFLIRRSMLSVWIYLLTLAGSVALAFWEVGSDWWAQVPRLVAPTVVLIFVLALIPTLRRHAGRPRGVVAASLAGFVAAGGFAAYHMNVDSSAYAQEEEPQSVPGVALPDAP